MKNILIILFLLSLNACATSPVRNNQADNIPNSRIYTNKYNKFDNSKVSVIIKRDKGFLGSLCSTHLYINSEHIADIRTKEKIQLYIPIGDYIVGAESGTPCAGGLREYSLKAEPGKDRVLRVGYGTNGDFFFLPTAFQ
ncbi:MAG: hypothetical protein N4A43_04395 [Alphaproteobacteria bacterium]|jgi:hypothetical protein|nr:hypothetical protein [Alphaproteobacteria bacterium]